MRKDRQTFEVYLLETARVVPKFKLQMSQTFRCNTRFPRNEPKLSGITCSLFAAACSTGRSTCLLALKRTL
ncbi:MAG: hypothetical protein AB1798_00060 [Spirochaetota bacterium]